MPNSFDAPEPGEDDGLDLRGPFPWDEPASEPLGASLGVSAPGGPRERHDAFTEARKSEFLKALVKTGCIKDACRRIGINPRTVYRHQQDHPTFCDNTVLALRMSGTPVELTAWARAVDGVEQEFAVGGQVHVRRRYDAGLLRLLLQGSNPKKYGPRPGFKRKRLLKHERKEIEREVRAEVGAKLRATPEETCAALAKRLKEFGIRTEAEEARAKLADGWTRSAEGHWVPPGYGPLPGFPVPAPGGEDVGGEEPPCESM